jgi:hypothetical protein
MSNNQINDFASYLHSLEKDKLIRIYLNNNICILAQLQQIQFFDDYLIYDGQSNKGTLYFPDQKKIYPNEYPRFEQHIDNLSIVPYSAICLIADAN